MNIFKSNRFIAGVCIILLVLSGALGAYLIYGVQNKRVADAGQTADFSKYSIVPVEKDSTGVSLNSSFKIISQDKSNISEIKKYLSVSPQDSYHIKELSSKEFLLSFEKPMKANSIYRFSMAAGFESKRSWAFQTSKSFTVVRTLPRDKATSVPQNTGIEITFSHENPKDFESHFEITPKVEGRFEYHKKTVVFVPKDNLQKEKVYTVRLKKGIGTGDSSKKTEEDYIFCFQVENENPKEDYKYFSFGDILYNFTTKSAPYLDVNVSENLNNSEVLVELFKYQDEDSFLKNIKKVGNVPYWAVYNRSSEAFDMQKLTKISSFKSRIQLSNSGYWYMSYLSFPEALEEGHYLASVDCDGKKYQTHLQVSDTMLFISLGKDKSIVWANNSSTGQPVAGAAVEIEGLKPVATSKDGVALINGKIPETKDDSYYYCKLSNGKAPSVFATVKRDYYGYGYYMNSNSSTATDDYWTYLYLDRGLYLPNDTVRTWGIAKPRESAAPVSKAQLQLFRYDYSYREINADGDFPVIDTKDVSLSPMGTYEGEMSLPDLTPGNYSLRLVHEGKILGERGFTVMRYTKPAYKIELDLDKKVMYSWEKARCNISASFFEGSPVAGLELNYNYYSHFKEYSNKSGTIKCDSNGQSSFEIIPDRASVSWHPATIGINVTNAKAEEQEVNGSDYIAVFPRDTMIEAKGRKEGDKGIVELKTSKIDISKVRDGNYFDFNAFRGNPVDMVLKAKLYEVHYNRMEKGEYYDFLNKKVQKLYDYTEARNVVQELEIQTTGGKALFEFPYQEDNETYRHYYVELTGNDGRGQQMLETVYIFNWPAQNYSRDYQGYSFEEVEKRDSYLYKTGEKVSLAIRKGQSFVEPKSGARALFLTLRNGIASYEVSENTKFETEFKSGLVPNFYVQAVYFDGSDIYNVGIRNVNFDSSEKKLMIDVQPDKSDYRPGDTVNLDVSVLDAKGKGTPAEINFSVVDEANFALYNQHLDTLASLYNISISTGIISEYVSSRSPNRYGGGAECGEGGDAGIRSVFKDTAFFGTVRTDAGGRAKLSFKLPDNLTSWRVSFQGVSEDVKAGSGKINIACKLPFFVDVMFNSTFMEGDNPAVTLRSFGSKLGGDTSIDYKVSVIGDNGFKQSYEKKGRKAGFSSIELGSLKEGSYSITAEGKAGNLQDAVKKEFKVVKSMLEITGTKYHKLSEDLKLDGGRGLTTLLFYNEGASAYFDVLNSLLYSWGERVDQKLARKVSRELLKRYFGVEEFHNDEAADLEGYQQSDGGIALLRYDSSDPVLTAKICSVSTDGFDRKALKAYFYDIINNKESTAENVSSAYWGLATLGEPVLLDILSLAASKDIDDRNKLYLALGLADIGDFDSAWSVYSSILASKGRKAELMMYIDGRDKDEIIELTSLCSMLALKLNAPEKNGLFSYAKGNPASMLLTNLELMAYAVNAVPSVPKESSFTYVLDGEEKNITIKKAEVYRLVLTKDKLDKIRFRNIKGDVTAAASFNAPASEFGDSSSRLFKVVRSYGIKNSAATAFSQSDLVKITLDIHFDEAAPDGYYEVTDVLPAAFRYVPPRHSYENNEKEINYPVEVDGQKIVFGFYYSKASVQEKRKIVYYYARSVCPGEFTADSAAIRHFDSNSKAFAPQQKIKVRKGGAAQ
ncbi:MAG: Ig-like domain-containing protein [Clostridia bacterium]|nr:Ig-like domain-containing protein [Clostridia bacterium]